VCTDDDADTIPAFIQSISLVSDGPSTSLTRPGLNVTLTFTISDETDLTSASQPPPSWTVTIGPEGSAPPVFISASTPSTSRSFVYRWTVPTAPQFTGIGYFINISDAAGNFRSVAVSAAINIGMDCERCSARMFCSLCSLNQIRSHSPVHVFIAGFCLCHGSDITPPIVFSTSLTNPGNVINFPFVARNNSLLTLTFQVSDDVDLPVTTAGWTISVGPEGSAAPTPVTVPTTGTNRQYVYRWTVPANPSYTSVGYTLNVSDSAGNWKFFSVASAITLGELGYNLICFSALSVRLLYNPFVYHAFLAVSSNIEPSL